MPSQRDGVLLVVGTEIKKGEKVPTDRIVTVKQNGQTTTYRRLREGDAVEEGQLLARVDDRLARLDLDVARSKLEGAVAELGAAAKTKEEAERRYQTVSKLMRTRPLAEEELSTAKLNAKRYAEEVALQGGGGEGGRGAGHGGPSDCGDVRDPQSGARHGQGDPQESRRGGQKSGDGGADPAEGLSDLGLAVGGDEPAAPSKGELALAWARLVSADRLRLTGCASARP